MRFLVPLSVVLITAVFSAPSSRAVVKRFARKAGPSGNSAAAQATGGSGDDGSQKYSPTRCEWLAIELNAHFRESYPRAGYTSQFYCRAPNTIFLSFHYIKDEFKDAADEADDDARTAIGQVMVERKWNWIKIDDEVVKGDLPAWPPAPAASTAKKLPPVPKMPDDDGETDEDKSTDGKSTDNDTADNNAGADQSAAGQQEVTDDGDSIVETQPASASGTPQPWVHMRHPEIEFQKKLQQQDQQAALAPKPAPSPTPNPSPNPPPQTDQQVRPETAVQ